MSKTETRTLVRLELDYLPKLARRVEIVRAKTALVIVDMQYATASRHHGLGKRLREKGEFEFARWRFDRAEQVVVPNIARLIGAFREGRLPVVYTVNGGTKSDYSDTPPIMRETYRASNNHLGTKEHEILDELKPAPSDFVVPKTTVGAFASSNIDTLLRSLGVEVLVFVGYSTNACVDQTARVAADLGYACILVDDGCGAATEEYHRSAMTNFARIFGRVAMTDDIVAALAEQLAKGGAVASLAQHA